MPTLKPLYSGGLCEPVIYVAVRDAAAERLGFLRVIDKSGDDYLYSRDRFAPLKLPRALQRAWAAAARATISRTTMTEQITHEQAIQRALAAKKARRAELARLPYEEKIAIALRLRSLALAMRAARANTANQSRVGDDI